MDNKNKFIFAYAVINKEDQEICLDGLTQLKTGKKVLAIYPEPVDKNQLDPFSECRKIMITI